MADCSKTIPAIIPERLNISITSSPRPNPSKIRKNEIIKYDYLKKHLNYLQKQQYVVVFDFKIDTDLLDLLV